MIAPTSPSLRTQLESSCLTDLEKIIRTDTVRSRPGDGMGSKRQFADHVSDVNAFRNPMAHHRNASEDVRRKREEAVGWIGERPGVAR